MHVNTRNKQWQLRWALAALSAIVAVIAAAGIGTGSAFADQPEQVPGINSTTAPSDLTPPPISVLHSSSQVAPGDVFVAPKIVGAVSGQQGPEIVDNQGRALWFQPIDQPYTATDFRVQTYQGKPVLTYDVGQSTGGPGHSEGEDVILDQHYNQVATVKARQRPRRRPA